MTDPHSGELGTPDRAEQAFRSALGDLPPDAGVDPARARRTVRSRRRARLAVGAVVTALVLVAGILGVPRLLDDPVVDVAAPVPTRSTPADRPTDPAPAGWRTEYYRSTSFQVPASWGHAYEPGPDWCAGGAGKTPDAAHRRPYVSLGGPSLVATVGCPGLPESLLTEHVATIARFAGDQEVSGTTRRGDWLVVKQVRPDTVLVVTTQDQAVADRIIDSAGPAAADAPCPVSSPVTGPIGARPAPAFALTEVTGVRAAAVCQYDPDGAPDDQVRLRAFRPLSGATAADLVDRLAAAPTNRSRCPTGPVEIAVVVRLWSDSGQHDVYVQAAGCDDPDPAMAGGVVDGQRLRVLSRSACRALLVPPVTLQAASGAVATNCLG